MGTDGGYVLKYKEMMRKNAEKYPVNSPQPIDWGTLLTAIRWKETGGHPDPNNAVGDDGLAVGGWQIHPNAWQDAMGTPHMVQATDPKTGAPLVDRKGNPVMTDLRKDPKKSMEAVMKYWNRYKNSVATAKRNARDEWVRKNSVSGVLPKGTVVPGILAGDVNSRDAALLFHYGPSYMKNFQDRHGYWDAIDKGYLNPSKLKSYQTRIGRGFSLWNAWKGRGASDTRNWVQYQVDMRKWNPGVDFNRLRQGAVLNTSDPNGAK